MSSDMKICAATVRQLREARAWSQEQLAAVSGISPRTVQRVENEGAASLDTRMALAAALQCEPAMLLESAVIENVAHTQPAASIFAQPSSTRPSSMGHSLVWLLLAFVACLAIAGYNVGQDLAEGDNRVECKRRATADQTTCNIDAAEQQAKVAEAQNAHVPSILK